MKIKTLLLLVIVAALTMSQQDCSSNNKNQPDITDPYIGGTSGVIINFEEGFPPEYVFDNSLTPFDVVVKLENIGEWEVDKDDVRVVFDGVRPEQFGKSSNDLRKVGIEENLLATKKDPENNIIESVPVYVSFPNLAFKDKIDGNFNPPIRATVCYKYGTKAVSNLCVTPDVLTPSNDNDLCIVNEAKTVYNSGGPIQVTELKEIARSKSSVSFTFKIRHKGTGLFFAPGTLCGEEDIHLKNKVKVDVDTGLDGLSCTGADPEGYVLLQSGERPITCVQEISTQTAFENRVNIQVTYDYLEDTPDKNLLVKHSE